MSRRLALFFLTLIAASLAPTAHAADDLKILDRLGLTRAVRPVEKPATVLVTVTEKVAGEEERPVLSNIDGIASDIPGVRDSDNRYIFSGVDHGTWQIKELREAVIILEVQIKP